ncbi:MAG TPA: PepSY domain-containing protein [Nitrosopumilaceae archaeon]|nr:PepSY domain-containing protein [Nitrosopumilaceae archaeon]
MLLYSMEAKQAEEIALGFLQQQYSMIKLEKSVLEEDGRTWLVDFLVTSFDKERTITVKVNARTGLILGWQ